MWVGRTFENGEYKPQKDIVEAHRINPDGTMVKLGEIPNVEIEGEKILCCEPHAIELDDGRILAHIRVQNSSDDEDKIFTVYQSESSDGGATWSIPRPLLGKRSGSPAHILKHSSGALISTYGRRIFPYGIRAMISLDGGNTWETEKEIYSVNEEYYHAHDLGYPSSIELSDGSIMTVFYTRQRDGSSIIMQQRWKMEK
ncbi:MAG: exo-alpha-sialidase [Clostridia bacterium]|nr:exo-alpha-sialidase [Clostridia bacterium]